MKQSNISLIVHRVHQAVVEAGFEADEADIHVEPSKTPEHGHFACNVAMLLAGKLGKNPRDIAQKIAENAKGGSVAKAEVAGPGFINLWIEQKFYTTECRELGKNPDEYLQESLGFRREEKRIVIEYPSPNIAKPLAAHHLLSGCIGDSLKRIYKAYGYKVFAENYPGDMGTQFGKLITAIRRWGEPIVIEKNPIEELLKLYVRFHNEAEKDPSLEDEARAEYKKFEEGDAKNRALWQKIVDWTMLDMQPLYDRLGFQFDGVHGESFFENKMQTILKEGRDKGVFVDGENGSWIVRPEDPEDPPAIVKKSDGATLYLTRDLAQMDWLEKEYNPNIIAWAVDVAQSLHFQQRFYTYRKLRDTATQFVHVVFGRMDFKGEGMSTRKGNVIKMKEVLDEAESRALGVVKEKNSELPPEERVELARIMGIGAVKYSILSQNRVQNVTFDWDRLLSFEGNSAPYLMYTAARARSIFRKGDMDPADTKSFELSLTENLETAVAIDLVLYPEALRKAAEEFKPNHIANYLYRLAQDFNTLYNALPVLQAETPSVKETRLLLTAGVLRALEHGLSLLGIETPAKM